MGLGGCGHSRYDVRMPRKTAIATPQEAITRTARVLPQLHAAALALMRGRKSSPVEVYLRLLEGAAAGDLRAEAAAPLRRRFNGFYGVRRNAAWRETFYDAFEAMKGRQATPAVLFEEALRSLKATTGRVEASFVSKAVATLHPQSPVIDKVLRDRFAGLVAAPPFGRGLDDALDYYAWLEAVMTGLTQTPQALAWFAVYDDAFAGVAGAATTHAVKKLDFLLWGSRSVSL